MPNFVALRQEVCKISAVKIFGSRKSGPKFTKVGDEMTCYRSTTHKCAPHAQFHRTRPNDIRENCYKFYTLQYFGAPGNPLRGA